MQTKPCSVCCGLVLGYGPVITALGPLQLWGCERSGPLSVFVR
jgi:hypothetical protein